MKIWCFGDYKDFTSLQLITNVLDIPYRKNDIEASQVYQVFYTENDVQRNIKYGEHHGITMAQNLLFLKQEALLKDSEISTVPL